MEGLDIKRVAKDLPESEIDKMVDLLVSAFRNDKFKTMLVGGHTDLFPDLFKCQLNAALIGGVIYVAELPSDGMVGIAIWYGPGQSIMKTEEQAQAGFNQFMKDLGDIDPSVPEWWKTSFMPKSVSFAVDVLGPSYKINGWHLSTIAVQPRFQRNGIGHRLVEAVAEIAARELEGQARHISCETQTEAARKFYKDMGLVEKEEKFLDGYGGRVAIWCLAKEFDPISI